MRCCDLTAARKRELLYLPGEAIVKAPGSAHEYAVLSNADALIAVVHEDFAIIENRSL